MSARRPTSMDYFLRWKCGTTSLDPRLDDRGTMTAANSNSPSPSGRNPAVRTRFAPSPTGYMHIGGMRTALFAWLWARHNGGQFVLRIDDTDAERNVEAAVQPILRAFQWLGLEWDEGPNVGGPFGPYRQSQRTELYQAAVADLLNRQLAYRDFDTPEQVKADRERAEAEKRPFVSSRNSVALSAAEQDELIARGTPYVVRFLVPRDRKVAIDDVVRGHVEWDCATMPDPVIMRSNGSVLYNFATVVDDSQMKISHVIRAEEHLTNTSIQTLLHEALGNTPPVFAHIPFITAPGSTKKLSKRDLDKLRLSPQLKPLFDRADDVFPKLGLGDSKTLSPVMVEYYERLGYLPAGILNALSRLGWSLDDRTEFMSLATVVEQFTLDRIVKAPAGFDAEKLQSYQSHWMNELSLDDKIAGALPFLQQAGWESSEALDDAKRRHLLRAIEVIGERLRIFSDVLSYPEFFAPEADFRYDEAAFKKRILDASDAVSLLEGARDRLIAATDFTAPALDKTLHEFVAERSMTMGQLVHALRIATTGRPVGAGLFESLEVVGRERCIRRIDAAIARAKSM